MIRKTRALPTYWAKPILFNEDDHFDFDKPVNNFVAAVSAHVSWASPKAFERIIAAFAANLVRYAAGEPLEGIVDLDAGY